MASDESDELSGEPGIEAISIRQTLIVSALLNIRLFLKILPHLMTQISQHKKQTIKCVTHTSGSAGQ